MTFTKKYLKVLCERVCTGYSGAVLAILAALVLTVAVPARSLAQRLGGTLQVGVTDKTGATVPDAKVTATNEDTKVVTNATTSGNVYVFPDLLPGPYTVEVTKEGFNKYVRAHVNVLPNQTVDAPAVLELGTVSTTVEVTAEGEAPVAVTSSQIQSGFSGTVAEQLPINTIGGDVKELAVVLPNTTTQPGGVAGSGGSIGGLRPRYNSFTIDGADDNSAYVNGSLTPVIEDSVADFTVLTNQFNAEYGHSAAGIFAITTKSGTNSIHGEAHAYNRSRNYDALDMQEVQQGFQNRYDYGRYGGSIGGPILKDRLFYFGAVEYQDENKASAGPTVNTPTAAGLATLTSLAATPAIKTILAQFAVAPTASSTETVNGVLIPVGTFQGVAPNFTHQHDFIVSLDGNLGKHSLRGRYIFDRQRQPEVNAVEPQPQFNGTNNSDARKIILNDVWALKPTLVNELRFSFSRAVGPDLVVPSAFANFPNVEIDSLGVDIGPNGCSPQSTIVNTYQWVDDVTKTFGKHTVKGGIEVRNNIGPSDFLPRARGEWDYPDLQSFINDLVPTGANGALRGAGSGFFASNFKSLFGFIQDDWKVTPKLTVNLGLRYEFNGLPRDEKLQNLNAISNDPKFGLIFGTPKTDKNNWAPRLGFAYDPFGTGRWSIRGGAGLFYDITPVNFPQLSLPPQLQSEQNPKITCALAPAPSWCPSFLAGTGGAGFLQGGGLAQVNVPPTTQAAARKATQGLMVDVVEPEILTWTLSLEHQLTGNTSFELRYMGNHAWSLPAQRRLNSVSAFDPNALGGPIAPLPTYLSAGQVPAAIAAPASTLLSFDNYNPAPLSLDGFLGVFTVIPPIASSVYHSGSVDVTHRISHGIYIRGTYTFGHVDDDATNELFTSRVNPRRALDGYNLRSDWGRSALDIRNKFAVAVVYDFPNVGSSNALAKGFLNGWEWVGTYLAQSGQPITALSGTDSNGNGDVAGDRTILNPAGVDRTGTIVDFVCNAGPGGATSIVPASAQDPTTGVIPCGAGDDANVVGYVAENSKAKYVQAQTGTRANVGRDTISTPGLNIWNMSVMKTTKLTERFSLQFRAATFNTFNHPNPSIGLPTNNGTIDQNQNANPLSTAYPFVTAGNLFLNNTIFNGGSRRMELGLKVIF
jgi:Carboxypeptidase regulatory-like domain/TonB dependent receptor